MGFHQVSKPAELAREAPVMEIAHLKTTRVKVSTHITCSATFISYASSILFKGVKLPKQILKRKRCKN